MKRLIHKNSMRVFEYVGEFTPQFSTKKYVELKNLKTNGSECFYKESYLSYFKEIPEQYSQISTFEEYDKLLKSGMFWEFHPELSGQWEKDKLIILQS